MAKTTNIKYCEDCMLYIELESNEFKKEIFIDKPYKIWDCAGSGSYKQVVSKTIAHNWECPDCNKKYSERNFVQKFFEEYDHKEVAEYIEKNKKEMSQVQLVTLKKENE